MTEHDPKKHGTPAPLDRASTWPAALAERLERAARDLTEDAAPGPERLAIDMFFKTVLLAVDASRARGEIPARKETT